MFNRFKNHVHDWLKDVENKEANPLQHSLKKEAKSCSSKLKSSNSSGRCKSKSSKKRALERKAKSATLLAAAKSRQILQLKDNQAEQIRVEEKLEKVSVISLVYDEIKSLLDKEKLHQPQLLVEIDVDVQIAATPSTTGRRNRNIQK